MGATECFKGALQKLPFVFHGFNPETKEIPPVALFGVVCVEGI